MKITLNSKECTEKNIKKWIINSVVKETLLNNVL